MVGKQRDRFQTRILVCRRNLNLRFLRGSIQTPTWLKLGLRIKLRCSRGKLKRLVCSNHFHRTGHSITCSTKSQVVVSKYVFLFPCREVSGEDYNEEVWGEKLEWALHRFQYDLLCHSSTFLPSDTIEFFFIFITEDLSMVYCDRSFDCLKRSSTATNSFRAGPYGVLPGL